MDPEHSLSQKFHRKLRNFQKFKASGDENQAQRPAEAITSYISAINVFPEHPSVNIPIYISLCKAYKQVKNAKEAKAACEQVLAVDPSAVEPQLLLAEIELDIEDDWESAERRYQQLSSRQDLDHNLKHTINQGLQNAQKRKKMAERKDYYKILGVERSTASPAIRKAYRKLALEWHPDKHMESEESQQVAAKKYVEICEAYEVLNDDEKRAKYDRGDDIDMSNFNPFGAGGSPFHFGGGGGHGGPGGGFTFTFHM